MNIEHLSERQRYALAALSPDFTAPAVVDDGREPHIIFELDRIGYAVPLAGAIEIVLPLRTTPLPFVPDWIAGVASLRGEIISVVDLRLLLGMTPLRTTQQTRLLVVRSLAEDVCAGLLVDSVSKIRRLDTLSCVERRDATRAAYLRGIVEHEEEVFALLDIDRLLAAPEMRDFDAQTSR